MQIKKGTLGYHKCKCHESLQIYMNMWTWIMCLIFAYQTEIISVVIILFAKVNMGDEKFDLYGVIQIFDV